MTRRARRSSATHRSGGQSRKKAARRFRLLRLLPRARTRGRFLRVLRGVPLYVQVAVALLVFVTAWLAINWTYQVVRKPSELWFPISDRYHKAPEQTWAAYGRLFETHSTHVITPELLAALAQAEGSGNPFVRTYWRWSFTPEPFEIYRPASSAVGMYQMTDATFDEARRYCVHDHAVVEDGPWYAWRSCWFNGFYTRVVPSHAIELAAAHLDRRVADTLARRAIPNAALEQKQNLAAVIHLCGASAGAVYASRGFVPAPAQRCGDHDIRTYLAKVNGFKKSFTQLRAARGKSEIVAAR
jgi:hypothetical protein